MTVGSARICLPLALALLAAACSAPAPTSAPPAAPTAARAQPTAPPAAAAAPAAPAAAAPTAAPAAAQAPPEPVTLKVGGVRSITNLPVFVALNKGYFREQGVDLEFEWFGSGVDILPQLGTGRVDVGEGSITPGFINAVARGLNLKAVADRASMGPGRDFAPLMVRKSDFDSGAIAQFSDLRDRKVGISNRWTGSHYKLVKLDQLFGLRDGDYTIETLPFSDMPAALENRAVDAVILTDPSAARVEQRGIAQRLRDERHQPQVLVTLVAFSEEMIATKRDAGNRYAMAYIKGVRDLHQALAERGARWEDLKRLVAGDIPELGDASLADAIAIAAVDPNGRVNARGYSELQDWYFENGQIQRRIPVEEMIDNSFVDYALARLGELR